jgi:hypothetical protein
LLYRCYGSSLRWGSYCSITALQIIRLLFIHAYKLPAVDFNFATYINKGIDHEIVNLMDIDVSSWLVLMVVIAANAVRDQLMHEDSSGNNTSSHWLFLALGWVLFAGFVVIYHRLNACTSRLLQVRGGRGGGGWWWLVSSRHLCRRGVLHIVTCVMVCSLSIIVWLS